LHRTAETLLCFISIVLEGCSKRLSESTDHSCIEFSLYLEKSTGPKEKSLVKINALLPTLLMAVGYFADSKQHVMHC
jgi:hypothetical protein